MRMFCGNKDLDKHIKHLLRKSYKIKDGLRFLLVHGALVEELFKNLEKWMWYFPPFPLY